jgi:RNA polymerase sigma factor (sigma-70 family)
MSDLVEDFYVATFERTLAAAQRISGDRHLAYDAAQEAYVVMVHRWDERKCRSLSDNQRYVIGIAANKIADWYRRNGRVLPFGGDDDQPMEEHGYDQVLDQLTLFKVVRDFLEGQPAGMRAVGVMYFLEGFEYAEIAHHLQIAASTVRTQVQRLRVRLRPLADRLARLNEGGEQS